MKKLRKIASLLIAMVMVVAMSATAFAATITVNGVAGQTYTAYKVFDVTTSTTTTTNDDGEEVTTTNYAYTITDDGSSWFDYIAAYATLTNGLTLTETTTADVYNVIVDDTVFSAASFATYLNSYINDESTTNPTSAGSVTIDEGETSGDIEVLDAGYYFLDSSLGALCILNTAADSVEVNEKNGVPTLDKTVSKVDSVTITGDVKSVTASIGDEVEFTLSLTAGGAADTTYVVHDVMSDGLTLDENSFSITVNGETVSASNYTIVFSSEENPLEDGCTFEITFSKNYTASLVEETVITITYTATVNSDIEAGMAETNSATLTYGGSTSTETEVEVYTYSFDLVKTTTDDTILDGAKFELYEGDADSITSSSTPLKFSFMDHLLQ